jgi:transposase
VPKIIIPKGYATLSLLSQIITSKYQYGLPLYQQEAMFKQYGIELSRKTMSDWMMKCTELLKPPYDRLHELIFEQLVIAADETTLKVVKEDKAKCYMWLYCTGTPDNKLVGTNIPYIVFYDYTISCAGKYAVD